MENNFDFNKIKENDFFIFEYYPEIRKSIFEPRHCFEGLLRAFKHKDKFLLRDTYWGVFSDSWDCVQMFTIEEALKKGTLTYYCNLNELKPIGEHEQKYYKDEDIFCLHEQHSCSERCRNYYIKKDAVRSQEKMRDYINYKRNQLQHGIDFAKDELKRLDEKQAQVEAGNLDIYNTRGINC
jgi:hypothetical protein